MCNVARLASCSLFLACLFAACGDIQVRSVRSENVVPATLQGEWSGTWTSAASGMGGALTVRVQEFAQEPVVSLSIDNPCLVPRDYELRLAGASIELLADGVRVLDAAIEEPRRLVGSYECAADRGTWSADWVRELPKPIDLSGSWSGTVTVPGVASEPMFVELAQAVRAGALVLDGMITLPQALPLPVPVTGTVEFGENDFQIVLQTRSGFQPAVVLTGIGDREPVQVDVGFLQVLSSAALPFSQGVFQMAPQPE